MDVVFIAPVDFLESIFKKGLTLRSTIFKDTVNFNGCRFEGPVDVINVQFNTASFYRLNSQGEQFSGLISKKASTSLKQSFAKVFSFRAGKTYLFK
jgi:hypothetical protein